MFAGVPRETPLRTAVIRRCRHGLSPDGRRRLLFSAIRAVEDHPQRQVLRKKLETVHDTRGREQEIARPERHALVADDIRSRASAYDINLVTPVRLLRVDVLGLVELDFELAAFEQDSVALTIRAGDCLASLFDRDARSCHVPNTHAGTFCQPSSSSRSSARWLGSKVATSSQKRCE